MINKGNLKQAILDAKNDQNNAVAYVYEQAQLNDFGPLAQSVYSIKNNYATGEVSADGSSYILQNFKPHYNATVFRLLNEAGATCAFKTHLDEFGLGGTGQYSHYGLIKNPLNHEHFVGGSSSGAAATMTNNIAFAIGSDTGDSVRLPGSFVGKVGFKPSYGAVSRYGLYAFASSLDTVAWFSHNVNDAFEVANVLFKSDFENDNTSIDLSFSKDEIKSIKPQKVAYLDCFDYLSDAVKQSYKAILEKLEKQGVQLEKIAINEDLLNSISVVYQVISFTEASSNLANLNGVSFGQRSEQDSWMQTYIKTRQQGLGVMVQRRLILGSYYLEKENQDKYLHVAQKMRRYLNDYFTKIHTENDLFIYPASKDGAPRFDAKNNKESFMDFILTNANLVGNPSLTLKMGTNDLNMPYSLAVDAKKFNDVKLLQHALYIEDLLGEK
ncbi:amidase family protein [[Mycoplasma] gypis]|uniref:Amidase family protein n=1 Tax=[Mycoplasma] gypis TaxID=92404 RepID=A0ABZ2RRH2_9BACT|nr:amidase family protein [[Mycoplasma] gypis]MBN0919252.1 Asp-tRNA(Asn)/Glu-tRNA(Gln) amidotransferase subunit GatA [[Mycoplasma] gypis]